MPGSAQLFGAEALRHPALQLCDVTKLRRLDEDSLDAPVSEALRHFRTSLRIQRRSCHTGKVSAPNAQFAERGVQWRQARWNCRSSRRWRDRAARSTGCCHRCCHTTRNAPQTQCPRPESNQRTRFRKPLLYPLSYGGPGGRVAGASAQPGRAAAEDVVAAREKHAHWRRPDYASETPAPPTQ
jgi:hypothetical protein